MRRGKTGRMARAHSSKCLFYRAVGQNSQLARSTTEPRRRSKRGFELIHRFAETYRSGQRRRHRKVRFRSAAARPPTARRRVVGKAGAGQLGRLLAAQWRTSRIGPSASPAGQLVGIARISLAPPPRAPALPTALPQPAAGGAVDGEAAPARGLHYRTLTLKFTGTDGEPAAAVGWVQNLNDARLGTYFVLPDASSFAPLAGRRDRSASACRKAPTASSSAC